MFFLLAIRQCVALKAAEIICWSHPSLILQLITEGREVFGECWQDVEAVRNALPGLMLVQH